MQTNPLLEKLDWIFTSTSWTLSFPDTKATPLSMPISDHTPYVVQISTQIPKLPVFCFENYWVEFEGFFDIVKLHWETTPFFGDSARTLSGKFKQVRRGFKAWSRELSKLNKNIHNCSWVIALIDGLEDVRSLSAIEKNFRKNVQKYMANCLKPKELTGSRDPP
jgi:hypothetical protein